MLNLKLLFLNFRNNKLGTFMTILLIALSVALSITVSLQERAFREGSAKAAERFDVVIGGLGSDVQLILSSVFLQPAVLPLIATENLTALLNDSRVEWAAPLVFGDFTQGMPIIGTSNTFIQSNYRTLTGRSFKRAFEAVVGAKTGYRIGDTFTPLHGQAGESGGHSHNEIHYEVVGILPMDHSIWDNAVLVPVESLWETHVHHNEENRNNLHRVHTNVPTSINGLTDIHDHAEQGISAIIVKPKSFSAAYQLRSQYRNAQTQAIFPAEVLVKVYATLGDGKTVLTWVAIAAQILVAIALMMIITLYLKQQQRQILAWRIFGAARSRIFLLSWLALLILIVIAVILGIIIGYICAYTISAQLSLKSGFALPVHFTVEDGYHIFSILCCALLMALIPSFMLYKQSPLNTPLL
ncbi:ABC transporter permease [Exercitatus varius]|uniref:ABC transporter permease n=1 Tax=Exercitatus varius TaxID=67857 RepID=UPI00294B72A0|nr:FtsX-like permease family protein [Exercitatus varius]MDG2958449.1 ABC transporter permease [Exercitatus varius]